MNNKLIMAIGLSVVAVVFAAIAFITAIGAPGAPAVGNKTESFWDSKLGYLVNGVTIFTNSGYFTPQAGTNRSYTVASSTSGGATAITLTQADILAFDTVLMTNNVGATTFTFPATSTLTTLVPVAGDAADQCWVNSTTTVNSNGDIIFAAGTGIDIETASSTSRDLTIKGSNVGCFKFIRKTNTDIHVLLTEYMDGD